MKEELFSNLVINPSQLRERFLKAIKSNLMGRIKLSKEIGIDLRTLKKFMNGQVNFHLEVLIRIENWVKSKGE